MRGYAMVKLAGLCRSKTSKSPRDPTLLNASSPRRIVFAFLYFASNVVVTLLLAVLIAYFLDPVVGVLERIHIPRALGALVVLLARHRDCWRVWAIWSCFARTNFSPTGRATARVLRHVTTAFDRQMSTVEKQVEAIAPAAEKGRTPAAHR